MLKDFKYLRIYGRFGKNYYVPKQDLDTNMIKVVSIDYQIAKLKELGLVDAKLDS